MAQKNRDRVIATPAGTPSGRNDRGPPGCRGEQRPLSRRCSMHGMTCTGTSARKSVSAYALWLDAPGLAIDLVRSRTGQDGSRRHGNKNIKRSACEFGVSDHHPTPVLAEATRRRLHGQADALEDDLAPRTGRDRSSRLRTERVVVRSSSTASMSIGTVPFTPEVEIRVIGHHRAKRLSPAETQPAIPGSMAARVGAGCVGCPSSSRCASSC